MVGYPSVEYAGQLELGRVTLRRDYLEGKLFLVEGITVHHTMTTLQGHSGSPILGRTKAGTEVVVGIHTHRGKKDVNKGLFFGKEMCEALKKL